MSVDLHYTTARPGLIDLLGPGEELADGRILDGYALAIGCDSPVVIEGDPTALAGMLIEAGKRLGMFVAPIGTLTEASRNATIAQAIREAGAEVTEPAAEPTEGWAWPTKRARSTHYFRDGRSLCGRYRDIAQPLDPDTGKSSEEDCYTCTRKLRAES